MRRFSMAAFSILLLLAFSSPGLVAGDKYRVPIGETELSAATAEEFLSHFVGELVKLKAIDRKGPQRSTTAIEVRGNSEKAGFSPALCNQGQLHTKVSRYPFSALSLEFPEGGKFVSAGKVKDVARFCLDPGGKGASGLQAKASRVRVFRDGAELARLHLVRFTDPKKLFQQMPRKIGN